MPCSKGFYKNFKSRYELVVYALAALELSKYGNAKLYQQEINGPLWIYNRDFDTSRLPISTPEENEEPLNVVPSSSENIVEEINE